IFPLAEPGDEVTQADLARNEQAAIELEDLQWFGVVDDPLLDFQPTVGQAAALTFEVDVSQADAVRKIDPEPVLPVDRNVEIDPGAQLPERRIAGERQQHWQFELLTPGRMQWPLCRVDFPAGGEMHPHCSRQPLRK